MLLSPRAMVTLESSPELTKLTHIMCQTMDLSLENACRDAVYSETLLVHHNRLILSAAASLMPLVGNLSYSFYPLFGCRLSTDVRKLVWELLGTGYG